MPLIKINLEIARSQWMRESNRVGGTGQYVYMCVCVCVCERERERETDRQTACLRTVETEGSFELQKVGT